MNVLVAVLAFIVAAEYAAIAIDIVPRLARLARIDRRTVMAARWGATAFFVGCAITHTMIGLQTLYPSLRGGMDMDMAANGSDLALLVQMVLPHIAQIVGGAMFIAISKIRLEVNITSKQEAAQVRELDRQFRSALDLAPVGIALFAPSGQLSTASYVNPAYLKIFGYEAHGPVPTEDDTVALVHPDDRAAVITSTDRIDAGEPVDLEFRIVRTDGAVRWVHARRNPLTDPAGVTTRVTSVLEDVTDRVNLHAALVAGERRFAQLADSVTLGIILRQLSPPKFLWANRAYARIVGADVVQKPTSTDDPALVLLHPGDQERVMNGFWPRAQAGKVAESEHRVLRPDGKIRWVHVTSNPVVDDDGTINRVAGTVEDITDRKNEAAQAARLIAERANIANTEFLSRMSHELRTPLNAVLGFAQLLELDPLTEPQAAGVHHILVAGRHLLTLIDDVLNISQVDSDRFDVILEPVEATPFLVDVIGLMEPAAAAAGIELLSEPHPAGVDGCFVSADRRRLRQVLLNLLSNAIKYNRRGGRVHVEVRAGGGALSIEVADTGIGIRELDLPRLFTPFDRLGRESTGIQGTGIGLALAYRLVAAMSGDLQVKSTEGTGSTFTVTLPLVAAPPREVPAPTSGGMEQRALTAAVSSLVYIEDNAENADLMARIVQRRPNWALIVAGDAAAGLELVRSTKPTLILLDLHLPDMHGIEVLARLRADPATADIPVIISSADANPREINRLKEAGAAGYRTKPLQVSDILDDLDAYATTGSAGPVSTPG